MNYLVILVRIYSQSAIELNQMYLASIAFGEMELSPVAYYGIIATGIIFLICFTLSSIPLAKNISQKNK